MKRLRSIKAMQKVKKAIIPAAGLGTRFLPATKTVPKEMLTIVDAPIILYVVEEAVEAGIEDIILVAGRGKHAIEDFFDTSYEVEDKLAKDGKLHLLDRLIRIREKTNIMSIRQKTAMGLGHAIHCASPIVGADPFAVLLGDEITVGSKLQPNVTSQLVHAFEKNNVSTVAVMEVNESDVHKYGICEPQLPIQTNNDQTIEFNVAHLIEKPKPQQTSSRYAMPGRYVFDNELMKILKNAQPSLNGEIQLTDSMRILALQNGMKAMTFKSERYDAGDKLGYLQANVELALKSPELGAEFKKYILQLAKQLRDSSL